MAQMYPNSEMSCVYYEAGKFEGDQRPRFLLAPFVVVEINGVTYLQPRPAGITAASLAQTNNADAEVASMSMQDYYSGERIVVPEHRMGDKADDWLGMHRFSRI